MRALPLLASSVIALAMTGCATAPREVPPPPPEPVPTPTPPPPPLAADWRDWPLTPGTWRYAPTAEGTAATFGVPGQSWIARLACLPAERQLSLALADDVATAATIRTTSATRAVTLTPISAGTEARLTATDPLLDAMAFSRGKFVVETNGRKLVLPAYAEIGRVIEDCRG